MPAEPDLPTAAANAYTNLYAIYDGTAQMRTALLAFVNAILPSFPDNQPNNHPIANWCAVLQSFANGLPTASGADPLQLRQAVNYVFRLCLLTNYLANVAVAPPLITPAQAAVVLAAYNANL